MSLHALETEPHSSSRTDVVLTLHPTAQSFTRHQLRQCQAQQQKRGRAMREIEGKSE